MAEGDAATSPICEEQTTAQQSSDKSSESVDSVEKEKTGQQTTDKRREDLDTVEEQPGAQQSSDKSSESVDSVEKQATAKQIPKITHEDVDAVENQAAANQTSDKSSKDLNAEEKQETAKQTSDKSCEDLNAEEKQVAAKQTSDKSSEDLNAEEQRKKSKQTLKISGDELDAVQSSCQKLDLSIQHQKAQLSHSKGLRNRRPARKQRVQSPEQEECSHEQEKDAERTHHLQDVHGTPRFSAVSSPSISIQKDQATDTCNVDKASNVKKHAKKFSMTIIGVKEPSKEDLLKESSKEPCLSPGAEINKDKILARAKSHTYGYSAEASQNIVSLREEFKSYLARQKRVESGRLSPLCSSTNLSESNIDISDDDTSIADAPNEIGRSGSSGQLPTKTATLPPQTSPQRRQASLDSQSTSEPSEKGKKKSGAKKLLRQLHIRKR